MADYVIRATAADGQIRAFAATTRDLVEQARKAHNTSPVASAALGRLLTAGVMMGVDMKGEDDVLTLKIQGDGPIEGLLVTADSHGNVKGYAYNPQVMLPPNSKGKLDVGGALGLGVLSVIKDIGLKEPLSLIHILLNELLSIIENAGRMGGPVPEWLRKYIAVLKDKIDSDYDPGHKKA